MRYDKAIRKLAFDKNNPTQTLFNVDDWIRSGAKTYKIELLEIKAANPADIVMVIKETNSSSEQIESLKYLLEYRSLMILQNNTYLLNIEISLDNRSSKYEISFSEYNDKDFFITTYGYLQ